MIRALVLALVILGPGCSGIAGKLAGAAISGGGGPDVAANVQAGRSNLQTIGAATVSDQRVIRPQARTIEQTTGGQTVRPETVERLEIRNGAPWGLVVWLVVALVLGWILPTPAQMWRAVWNTSGKLFS